MPSRPPRRAASAARPPGSDGDPAVAPIPPIWCDPQATLHAVDITVSVLGQDWTIPAMSAAGWLDVLFAEPLHFFDIFPGVVNAGDEFFDAMIDGKIDSDELVEIGHEVLEAASGFRWWFTLNLVMQAKVTWPTLGGALARRGVDPHTMPLGQWLATFLAFCLENVKSDKAASFVTELNTPPKGYEDESAQTDDGAAFLSAMRQTL